MILYINNKEINNEKVITINNVDTAIEKLMGADINAIIISSEIENSDTQKLKTITSILSPETLVVTQTGSLEDSLKEVEHLEYLNRMAQYQINDTLAPQNLSCDINIA